MARDDSGAPDERVRRSVARTLANLTLLAASLALLGAWAYFGFYQLDPRQAAVILRYGEYVRTEGDPGLRWHLPPPVESHVIVNVESLNKEEFGTSRSDVSKEDLHQEASMQTSDNNIVHVAFVVQYRIKDAFKS